MSTFWILIAIVVLISLALIWIPHFRQQKLLKTEEAGIRKQTNLDLFNARIAVLEKELAEGLLDNQEFDALKKELEISLLQDLKQGSDETLSNTIKPKGVLLPILMSVTVLLISGYTYERLGKYNEIANPPQANNPHQGMSTEQIMAQRLKMMEATVQAEPGNSQALFDLGYAYLSANRFDDSANTFDKVMQLLGGPYAELLGPKATALYYKNNQRMSPEIQQIVDQALSLDPKDPATLMLVGMDSFLTGQYQKAIDAWQTILSTDRTDVDRATLANYIETAKTKLGTDTGEMPQDAVHQGAAATGNASVTLDVSVAPELAAKVADTDMLFVFARTLDGSNVPVAIAKISAKALPTTITLDDSTNMMGGNAKLSDSKNVQIIAVLSKSGDIKPKSGDIKASLPSVKVGGDKVNLILDTLVP